MTGRTRFGSHRRLFVPIAILACLVVSSSAAAASFTTPDSQTGKTGPHSLTDTGASQGATCFYGLTVHGEYHNDLTRIRVRPPVTMARAGKPHQVIGWQVRVQAWTGAKWVPFTKSAWVLKTAQAPAAAPFAARSMAVNALPHHDDIGFYRVRNQLRWYGSDGLTVVGTATMYDHFYRVHEDGFLDGVSSDACHGTTG